MLLRYALLLNNGNSKLLRLYFDNAIGETMSTIKSDVIIKITGNNGGALNNSRAIDLAYEAPDWIGYAISTSDKMLHRIEFLDTCIYVNSASSTEFEPGGVNYKEAGDYLIELTAYSSNGNFDKTSQSITILSIRGTGLDWLCN